MGNWEHLKGGNFYKVEIVSCFIKNLFPKAANSFHEEIPFWKEFLVQGNKKEDTTIVSFLLVTGKAKFLPICGIFFIFYSLRNIEFFIDLRENIEYMCNNIH